MALSPAWSLSSCTSADTLVNTSTVSLPKTALSFSAPTRSFHLSSMSMPDALGETTTSSQPTTKLFDSTDHDSMDHSSSDDDEHLSSNNVSSSHNGPKQTHVCSVCSKVFAKNAKLVLHMMSHTGEKPFKCTHPGCSKSYARKNHLDVHTLSHLSTIESRKPYACTFGALLPSNDSDNEDDNGDTETCSTTGGGSTISRLIRSTTETPEYRCTARFTSLYHLNRHLKAHRDPLPHKCTFKDCPLSFSKSHLLRTHMASHTGTPAYPCTQCPKSFTKPSALADHTAKTHTVDAGSRYRCGTCLEAFGKWSLLQHHIRDVHPPTCRECNKVFSGKAGLRAHEQTHLLEREVVPCVWDGCGKVFSTRSNWSVHVRAVHLGEKRFVCEGCGERFGYMHLLARHRAKVHGGVSEVGARDSDTVKLDSNEDMKQEEDVRLLLSGFTSTSAGKELVCPTTGCLVRFGREYDLFRHLETAHGQVFEKLQGLGAANVQCKVIGCFKEFRTDQELVWHWETVHGSRE
ncbi:hypothetical protein BCR33DRAFT_715318 [Rhizoclosmatium globosum]|uniref:C2H2-type domain-containing protein n=1 Tax=Rhizoclosmatium globosum TaxID=329046 RepID=A0A1Y2CIN4_9FUNG|nr:hypothetical protein BCR33DRAFT_715318 [Rhizoclosmatium globosum]|eukprot:ORY46918.1 hypothetical protein BCR33DRAFT_715318 [Rhizoclosmatium globosum]